jgi:flagellar hook protein FlgE
MSLFGALDTSASGLTSQAAAFTNISDDLANSQSTGFKRVDTSFDDFLTDSTAAVNNSGAVEAVPNYINTIQGTITSTDNPLALAIKNQGFFSVSLPAPSTTLGAAQTFLPQVQYTRDGNFQLNSQGYLVNDIGQYLNAWPATSTGAINRTSLSPIQIDQSASYKPVPTTTAAISANLPPTTGTTASSSLINVYDSLGQAHQLDLTFTPTGTTNTWTVTVTDDSSPANTIGSGTMVFAADGTLSSVTDNNGGTTTNTSGATADLTLNTSYSGTSGNQTIALDLGTIGASTGMTQFSASSYTLNSFTQNGVASGTYTGTAFDNNGNVIVSYSNGASTTVGRVPVVTFPSPDSLQRQDGQSFTETLASGAPNPHDAGVDGSGGLAANSLESSNVDIGSEFTNLIVAQNAYSANAKVVTADNTLLQTTINMVQ